MTNTDDEAPEGIDPGRDRAIPRGGRCAAQARAGSRRPAATVSPTTVSPT